MVSFLLPVVLGAVFLLGKEFFLLRGRKSIKFYFICSQFLFLSLYIYLILNIDWLHIIDGIIFQVVFIIYILNVNKFIKDDEKMRIYDIFYQTPFTILAFSGLNDLVGKEREVVIGHLQSFLLMEYKFDKRNILVVRYKKEILDLGFVFYNLVDYHLFRDQVDLEELYMYETEMTETGVSFDYKIPINI